MVCLAALAGLRVSELWALQWPNLNLGDNPSVRIEKRADKWSKVGSPKSESSQRTSALLKALARAHRWQRLLESGEYGTLAELADAERISRSYVSRVLRLTLLAPDVIERILYGRPTAGRAQFLNPFPAEWERQRDHLL